MDLYLSDITYELKTLLIEEYANEKKPCDGEVYHKIREYQFLPSRLDNNVSPTICISLEMRWWARLNESREKKLWNLFRNSTLATEFDALGKIPGLFDAGMMVTTLHKMMATKCYEVSYSWRAGSFTYFLFIKNTALSRVYWKGLGRIFERDLKGTSKGR